MPTYWYVSADKLEALGASGAGPLGRLRTTLKLGVGGTGMEVGLDAAGGRSLERAVVKAEKQLRRHDDIADVAAFAGGPPPAVYFRCQGQPAERSPREYSGRPLLTTTWRSCLWALAPTRSRRSAALLTTSSAQALIRSAQFAISCKTPRRARRPPWMAQATTTLRPKQASLPTLGKRCWNVISTLLGTISMPCLER